MSDWTCKCGANNFRNRDKCFHCGLFKSKAVSSQVLREDGDWNCKCGELNFKSRTSCRKCGGQKTGISIQHPEYKYEQGDWKCNCGELNFKSRSSCRKCGIGKSHQSQPIDVITNHQTRNEYTYKEGDWKCQCGEMNFESRLQCRKCHVVKADIINKTNEDLKLNPLVCSICMVNPKNVVIVTCKHQMCCSSCIEMLRTRICPICRLPFLQSDLVQTFV